MTWFRVSRWLFPGMCLVVLSGALHVPVVQAQPTLGAGILEVPDSTSAFSTRTWLWNETGLFLHVPFTTDTVEIFDPAGDPIVFIRAVVATPDATSPTGSSVWIWTDSRVLHHVTGTTTTAEILDSNGNALANVRGIIGVPDSTSPSGSSVWIWNGAGVFVHQFSTTTAQEVVITSGLSVLDARGVIGAADATSATGSSVWVWTSAGMYLHQVSTLQVTEITDTLANPLAGVRGVLATDKSTSPTGTGVWIRNGAGVYFHQVATTQAVAITDSGGAALTDVRGMVGVPDSLNPSGTSVWIWNPAGLYLHQFGTTTTTTILDPLGNAHASTRGVIGVADTTQPTGTAVFVWNGAGVYLHQTGTTSTVELTTTAGTALLDARGMVGALDGTSPTGSSVWTWTSSGVFHHVTGTTLMNEITDTLGNVLANVRGLLAAPDPMNGTGSSLWVWNGAGVFRHIIGSTSAEEITDCMGQPLANAWCAISAANFTSPALANVWVRNAQGAYFNEAPLLCMPEVLDLGNSIHTVFYDDPLTGQAIVHNNATVAIPEGGEGAGMTPGRPPFDVQFSGAGVRSGADAAAAAPMPGLSTVVAGSGMQSAPDIGVTLSNNHVAVVVTFKEVPGFGACCSGGACAQVSEMDCTTTGGQYQGDGSQCLGDNDGDGFDDLCTGGVCEPFTYRLDDGTGDLNVGVTHGPGADAHSLAWLNRYTVAFGSETITHVRVAFGNVPLNSPLDVYVWDDPNQDGDPSDAIVVSSASVLSGAADSNVLVEYDIPDITLNAGEVFFAGAIMNSAHGTTPARMDDDGTDEPPTYPPDMHSYFAAGINGAVVDPNDLDASGVNLLAIKQTALDGAIGDGNWMVRPVAPIPFGACCDNLGGCQLLDECDCQLAGGTYMGHGSVCDPTVCTPADIGACCSATGCSEISALDCADVVGQFHGAGTSCIQVNCLCPNGGACCMAGTCATMSEAACTLNGGSYLGFCTFCTADVCTGCQDDADCADGDADGIRDDNCTFSECVGGACVETDIVFADMGGQFGQCGPDGTADGNDRFHALNCFANTDPNGGPADPYMCEPSAPQAYNVDAGGPFGSCAADGVCDGNDAFHALNAFDGTSLCSCPANPAPAIDPIVIATARLILVPHTDHAAPGEVIDVHVYLDTPLKDLRGYQLHVRTRGGRRAELRLIDMGLHQPSVLTARSHSPWSAFNVETRQLLIGLDEPGIPVRPGYLATFTFQVPMTARGTYLIELCHDDRRHDDRTFLFTTDPATRIAIKDSMPALLTITPN